MVQCKPIPIQQEVYCPKKHYKTTYWEATCNKLCSVTQYIDNQYRHFIFQSPCFDNEINYCCSMTYEYCWDDAEQVFKTYETPVGHTVNCWVGPVFDDSFCPPGIDREVVNCTSNCIADTE